MTAKPASAAIDTVRGAPAALAAKLAHETESGPIVINLCPKTLEKTYDGIIIGAGHHGLILGSYLAKAGLDILLVERRLTTAAA